jgi:dTDP-4-dehydrorhamnose 3,5-epimerase
MEIVKTPIEGCFLIKNTLFSDERGYFFESFNQQKFASLTGWQGLFVQDNQSESVYGVVRGLHFQKGEYAQAKLVRSLKGSIIDVVLDLRPASSSFGKVFSLELNDAQAFQLFIPRGCAHGFSVISPSATFFYKCDNYYNKDSESGINPMDKTLNLDWKIPENKIILSPKDEIAQSWEHYKSEIKMQLP